MLGVPHPETLPSPRATLRSIKTLYWLAIRRSRFSDLVTAVLGVLRRQVFGIRQASCPQRAHTNAKQRGIRPNAEDHRRDDDSRICLPLCFLQLVGCRNCLSLHSDLKSVRSPDRRRSRPPDSVGGISTVGPFAGQSLQLCPRGIRRLHRSVRLLVGVFARLLSRLVSTQYRRRGAPGVGSRGRRRARPPFRSRRRYLLPAGRPRPSVS